MKKLLLIAYFYPPLGGPGVQRPLKLIKYLRKFGWETDVITVKDIVFHSYDNELAKEDLAANVYRIKSFDPMSLLKKTDSKQIKAQSIYFQTPEKIKKIIRNLFPIDEKIGWLPAVMKAAKTIFAANNYQAIMATMGPYTSGVIAYKLSQKYDLPLLIDYRDHWSLNPYFKYANPILGLQAERWEKKILQRAKAVSVIGEVMKDELCAKFGCADKIITIFNGWDEDDFQKNILRNNKKIILRYIGNFYAHRTVKYFVEVVEKLGTKLLEKIEIELVGNYYQETLELINQSPCRKVFKIRKQVNHPRAIELMKSSDILLLFIASKNGKGVLTGKIFEYIRSEKPILAMIPPDGEAATILRNLGHKHICAMEDTEKIKIMLLDLITLVENNSPKFNFEAAYNREHQTEKFVNFIEQRLWEK